MTNLRKAISILLSISVLLSLFVTSGFSAFADESKNFTYSVSNGKAVITSYTGDAVDLEIPSKIDNYTISGIDANTFFYAKNLERITIPSTVTDISPFIFQGYVNIKEINVNENNKNYSSKDGVLFNKSQNTLIIYPSGNERASYLIPQTVATINSHAFYNAQNLVEISIPNGVKTIEYYAFDSCTSLAEIKLPSSVSSIGELAFYRCSSLKNITVDDANGNFSSQNGVLFNKAQTDLIKYPSAINSAEYNVPKSVKNIGSYAFDSAKSLVKVNLSDGLVTIGSNAFKNCTSLSEISIPKSVNMIDSGAFHGCGSLKSIKLPSSITAIYEDTFFNCVNLAEIEIPSSVKSIGAHAFENCSKISSVAIPSKVTTIGASAFNNCKKLAYVSIPTSVKVIGESAFAGCAKNIIVKYAGSKTDWEYISIGANNNILNSNVRFSKLHFVDLKGYEYYEDYVKYTSLYNSYITGTNPPARTMFSPEGYVTRAMFVTILYRMAGEPYSGGKNPHKRTPFYDITDKSVYYYDAACWALDKGVTNQTYFKPDNYVTREQTATFLFRYAKEKNMIKDNKYLSVKLNQFYDYKTVSPWATEALQWANYTGMITGTQQKTLNPQGYTKRIHATKILYGFGNACNIGNFS